MLRHRVLGRTLVSKENTLLISSVLTGLRMQKKCSSLSGMRVSPEPSVFCVEDGGKILRGEACSTVPVWIREGQGSASREAGQTGGRASMQNTQLSPGEGGQAQQHATELMEASACCWDAVIYVFFLSSFSQNTPCLCLCQPLALGTPYHSHSILRSPSLCI